MLPEDEAFELIKQANFQDQLAKNLARIARLGRIGLVTKEMLFNPFGQSLISPQSMEIAGKQVAPGYRTGEIISQIGLP